MLQAIRGDEPTMNAHVPAADLENINDFQAPAPASMMG